MSQTLPETSDDIAVHEAGHAIVGLALGLRLESIHVNHTGGSCWFERCYEMNPPGTAKINPIKRWLTLRVGGHVAEEVYFESYFFRCFSTASDRRKFNRMREEPITFRSSLPSNNPQLWRTSHPHSDYTLAYEIAKDVLLVRTGWAVNCDDAILRLIQAAEHRAERIIKKKWNSLITLRNALISFPRSLTAIEVLDILRDSPLPDDDL